MKSLFFFIFAISGFSGIIYESIWTHYLKLFLGHAAYAQTLVLAIFMGGMAIGAWLCSIYSLRWRNLFLAYALAEGIIGVSALFFHPLFDHFINLAYTDIIPQIGSAFAVQVFKWTCSSLLILPQSILLGMTFPIMSAAIIRHFPDSPGGTISMLYFTNSFGAAIGILISGFVLIGQVGLPGTIVTAGLINIALALIVWRFSIKESPGLEFNIKTEKAPLYSGRIWFLCFLCVSFLTGLASFIYEIGWIRMLSLVLSSSTHSFELMLSSFIFGLAFGGLWIKRRIDSISKPIRFLAFVQLAMGMLALITLPLYGKTFNVMRWLVEHLDKTEMGYFLFNLSSHGIALMVMLPATFCAGMTLPLITYVLIRQGHGERSIGAVYTANTLGAISGIIFAVHLGMPVFGLKGLITTGAAIDILLALFLLWFLCGYSSKRIPLVYALASLALILVIFFGVNLDLHKMASGVYRTAKVLEPSQSKVLFHRDGKTASISMVESGGSRSIRTNGKVDASVSMRSSTLYSSDEPTMILLAAIPMLFNPDAKTAANIGMGSGLTTHTLLTNPFLERVDTIEIEQAMVDAARGFLPKNKLAYTDPRSRIYIDDAKTFFSAHNKKYDIIISEPSNPWVSGVSGLFSEEFYPLAKRHLRDKGLFVQWLQLYEIDVELVSSVMKALNSTFPYYDVYAATDEDILIVAMNDPIPDLNSGLFNISDFSKELQRIGIVNIQDVEIRKIGNNKLLQPLFESFTVSANSEYYPVLDLLAAKARFKRSDSYELLDISKYPLPLMEMLSVSKASSAETKITQSSRYVKSEAAYQATQLRDYFLFGTYSKEFSAKNKNALDEAIQLKNLLNDCKSGQKEEDNLVSIFLSLSRIVSYLRPSELDLIWEKLENKQCFTQLSEPEQDWLYFFKIMGKRELLPIAKQSEFLLNKYDNLAELPLKCLITACMASNIALGHNKKAKELWLEYEEQIFDSDSPDLVFRTLNALIQNTD